MDRSHNTQISLFVILSMKKHMLREVKQLVQSHTASKWQSWGLNLGLSYSEVSYN